MSTLKRGIAIAGFTLMTTTSQASQTEQMSLTINKELVEDTLFITPYATSALSGSFTYQLKIEKKGKSGSAINQQSGQVLFIPGLSTRLSEMRFNYKTGDIFNLNLSILRDNKILATLQQQYPHS